MNVNSTSQITAIMPQLSTSQSAQLSVLKNAIELQGQLALQLVLSAAQSSSSNPPNLGNGIDVYV